jgi:hypothetical protein
MSLCLPSSLPVYILLPVQHVFLSKVCLFLYLSSCQQSVLYVFCLPVYMYIRPACLHCNENHIYVFPEKEMCGRSPNFQILVSVNILYVPRIGPHTFLRQNRQTDRVNIYIAHRHLNVEIGTVAKQFLFWEDLFRIFDIVSLQCSMSLCMSASLF